MKKVSFSRVLGGLGMLVPAGLWLFYVINCWEHSSYVYLPYSVYYVVQYGNTAYTLSAGLPMMAYCLLGILPAAVRSAFPGYDLKRKRYLSASVLLLTAAVVCMLASTGLYPRFFPWISRSVQENMLALYVHTIPVSFVLSVLGTLVLLAGKLTRAGKEQAGRMLRRNGYIIILCLGIAFITTIGSLLLLNLIYVFVSRSAVAWVYSFCRHNASNIKNAWISIVCAPIVEEIAFRGCICKGLNKTTNRWTAILISSLCFGLWHRNLGQFCYTFVWGVMYGYLTLTTGTIAWPMLIHCASNVLAILAHSDSPSNVLGAWPMLYAFRGWLLELPVWISGVLLILVAALTVWLLQQISLRSKEKPPA